MKITNTVTITTGSSSASTPKPVGAGLGNGQGWNGGPTGPAAAIVANALAAASKGPAATSQAVNEGIAAMQASMKADFARMGMAMPSMGGSSAGQSLGGLPASSATSAGASTPSAPVQTWGQSGGTLRLYKR